MKTIQELFDLSGKTAIVTGGAVGIGAGIAYRLSEAGANVVIADIDPDKAEKTSQQLPGSGIAVRTDVSKEEDVANMVRKAVDAFGGLDVMVNNAGIYPMKPSLDMTVDEWERVLDINLRGAFLCAREAARRMIAQDRGGRLINIASIDSVHPSFPGLLAYDASKGGMMMLTKSLAIELAAYGILVNAIGPGGIRTPGATGGASEEQSQAFAQRIPLKRLGEPDDIGIVALFLASDASAYMTGSFVVVDGGMLVA
ncbi:MAG: SDR family NAD(P)-dependent oxidoreductase [Thermoleophilia bacterium]